MIYIPVITLFVLYAFFFHKFIRKYEFIHYGIALALAIPFALVEGFNFFNSGFPGVSMFIIVMFTGVLHKGRLKRALNQVRAQYAIIGFILISGHSLPYLIYLLDEGLIFVHLSIVVGIICFIIFIPLTITSFMIIRRRMTFKQWKMLHRLAYLSYGLIFVHLVLLNNSRMMFYIVLFTSYGILKLIAVIDKRYTLKKMELNKKMALSKQQ